MVILIDSLEDALQLDDLKWLPTKLNDNVKLIITTTSNTVQKIDDCKPNDLVLWNLKEKISKANFAHLKQFSDKQWAEVLSYGGGDFYSANAHLKFPDTWKCCNEKIPLRAKV